MARASFTHYITDDSALGGMEIERSLRFDKANSSHLSKTFSSAGNRKVWTWSAWIRRAGNYGSSNCMFHAYDGSSSNRAQIAFDTGNRLIVHQGGGGGSKGQTRTDRRFRDSNWYHIVCVANFADSTAADRVKMYVNGVLETKTIQVAFTDENGLINSNLEHELGAVGSSSNNFDGYMAEINFIDGQNLDPSYFGYSDFQTGKWRPKRYEGTYGQNGFHLEFKDNSGATATTIGKDTSGNQHNFTPANIAVSNDWQHNDSFIDTPTNTFPILSLNTVYRVYNSSSDVYNGGMKYNCHYDNQGSVRAAMPFPTSGKWYFEVKLLTSNSNATFGIVPALWSQDHNAVQETGARMYAAYGQYFVNGTATSGLNGWGTSDTVAAALDMDEKKITFYKNNSVEITLALESGYENVPYLPILTGGTNGGSVNLGINFGANESWTYTPPAGFKSLCTNNLPPSASSPILKPQAHFDTVLWTGNGGTSQTVTGLEFQPDFVWVKGRSTAAWNRLQNSVVGANKLLYSNASNAEATDEANGYVSEFTSSGFQLADPGGNGGGVNASGETYAAWCWKAGGTAVSNSDGTIASQVSVNQDAGFSIVSYTGDGNATATIGHGLGKKPKWIITKCRSTATQADWVVWHEDLDDNKNVFLDKTNAQSTPSYGHITDPTSTLINVTKSSGNQTNASGQTYISYCWAEIPGYSKFSSYVGDGNNDGPFIHMGFSPAFLLLKCVGSSANWVLIDIKRNGYTSGGAPSEGNFENFKTLCPNLNNAENASGGTTNDINSNGFKIRGGTDRNISGQKHIYIAFAERPDSTAYDTEPNAR